MMQLRAPGLQQERARLEEQIAAQARAGTGRGAR